MTDITRGLHVGWDGKRDEDRFCKMCPSRWGAGQTQLEKAWSARGAGNLRKAQGGERFVERRWIDNAICAVEADFPY